MAFSFSSLVNDGIVDAQVIYAWHVTEARTGINTVAGWFTGSGGVPGKIRLFTSTTAEASLLLPSGVDPTSPVNGDFWNNSGTLKFHNGSATKTIAFTDSAITTLSVSGTSTLTGAATFNSTLTANGAVTANAATTVKTTSATAFRVLRADIATNFLLADTNSRVVEIRKDDTADTTTLGIYNASSNLTVSVAGATGNITTTGAVSAATITSAGAIVRGSTAYAAPALLNTGGFTINLGNGTTAISSGVQLPAVTIPYACRVEYWAVTTSDPASTNTNTVGITVQLQKRESGANTAYANFGSTLALSSGSSQASASIADPSTLTLQAGDTIRVVTSGTITAKAVAVHVRVIRV